MIAVVGTVATVSFSRVARKVYRLRKEEERITSIEKGGEVRGGKQEQRVQGMSKCRGNEAMTVHHELP